jgi:hypothetical protein
MALLANMGVSIQAIMAFKEPFKRQINTGGQYTTELN